MPRWRSTGRFQSKAGELCECACTRSQYGFHSVVGDLVLTCFVAPCRYHLLAQATQLSTTHHLRVLTCFERVDGFRNRIDWFGGEDRRLAFDIVREQLLAWTTAKWCFADCSGEHFACDETNKQFLAEKLRNGPSHLGAPVLVRHQLPVQSNRTGSWFPGEKGLSGTSVLQHCVWTFSCLGMYELTANELLLESPSCQSWTRRLADNHGRCFAPRRQ